MMPEKVPAADEMSKAGNIKIKHSIGILLYFIPFVLMAQEKQIEGVMVKALPSGYFRVKLLNDSLVLGYLPGQVKRAFIRFYKGDTVIIAMVPKGRRYRIIYSRKTDDPAP
ncbi:S1 domain-containing protein [Chitinophaga polysaccharea]|nr:hypothetical protein [Chitinophaga polysaccharea]